MKSGVLEPVAQRYEAMVRSGRIVPDPIQRALVAALDGLNRAIKERKRTRGRGWLGQRLLRRRREDPPRGFYIWGAVGRGKTLLMDIFFESAPTALKRRVHFHEFMAEVHDRIAVFRKEHNGNKASGDPIPPVARDIASKIELLCFDEFAVYDIADAMILGRLFEQLFSHGVIVVATTNVAPDDLYKGGLNRALFLPFIALLKQRMSVFHLDAPSDYRLGGNGNEPRYVTPLDAQADACLDDHFMRLTGRRRGMPAELVNKGRRVIVPQAVDGVARFQFDDLCSRPLGASDYLLIAERFHTVVLDALPILSSAHRNEAKRFINLIDTLYDKRIRLIVSAAEEPVSLWQGTDATVTFEFLRVASRLMEMRSDEYWRASEAAARLQTARKKEARTL